MSLLDELDVLCPYCASPFVIEAEPDLAGQAFIEDCPVCCAPVEFILATGPEGDWQLTARRDDE